MVQVGADMNSPAWEIKRMETEAMSKVDHEKASADAADAAAATMAASVAVQHALSTVDAMLACPPTAETLADTLGAVRFASDLESERIAAQTVADQSSGIAALTDSLLDKFEGTHCSVRGPSTDVATYIWAIHVAIERMQKGTDLADEPREEFNNISPGSWQSYYVGMKLLGGGYPDRESVQHAENKMQWQYDQLVDAIRNRPASMSDLVESCRTLVESLRAAANDIRPPAGEIYQRYVTAVCSGNGNKST